MARRRREPLKVYRNSRRVRQLRRVASGAIEFQYDADCYPGRTVTGKMGRLRRFPLATLRNSFVKSSELRENERVAKSLTGQEMAFRALELPLVCIIASDAPEGL
jgi:hypothetical protein